MGGVQAERRGSPGRAGAHSGSPDQPTLAASCLTASRTEVAVPVPTSTRSGGALAWTVPGDGTVRAGRCGASAATTIPVVPHHATLDS
jgi:hypothetical protein